MAIQALLASMERAMGGRKIVLALLLVSGIALMVSPR